MRPGKTLCFLLLLLGLFAGPEILAKKGKKKDPSARLYAKRCAGSCHRLYKPKEYTAPQWIEILEKMSERARLKEEEAETIQDYLTRNARKEDTEDSPGESPPA